MGFSKGSPRFRCLLVAIVSLQKKSSAPCNRLIISPYSQVPLWHSVPDFIACHHCQARLSQRHLTGHKKTRLFCSKSLQRMFTHQRWADDVQTAPWLPKHPHNHHLVCLFSVRALPYVSSKAFLNGCISCIWGNRIPRVCLLLCSFRVSIFFKLAYAFFFSHRIIVIIIVFLPLNPRCVGGFYLEVNEETKQLTGA